jgi:cytochrome c oxidase cbb3-type subunit III
MFSDPSSRPEQAAMWRNGAEGLASIRRTAAAFLLAAVAGLTACGEAPPAALADASAAAARKAAPASPQELELGRAVYNYRCYFCHGYSGDARTLATTYLSPKPRDFSATALDALPREAMLAAVRDGRSGTAMKGFTGILSAREMNAVTDFVRHEFMDKRAENTRYHTAENGWPDHERNRVAFPFARGELAIDTPWESLDAQQQEGKRLFLNTCITCHDHGRVKDPGAVWESRPVTFPRDAYCTSCHQDTPRSAPLGAAHPQRPATHTFSEPDGSIPLRRPQQTANDRIGAAYLVHDRPPVLRNASALELQGEKLFQKNCAFCHAADGTSKGWIGSFLEPHPRDLTSDEAMKGMTRERMARSIAEGLPGTSMPAWQHVLGNGEIDALIAYISRAFHPVAGVRGS